MLTLKCLKHKQNYIEKRIVNNINYPFFVFLIKKKNTPNNSTGIHTIINSHKLLIVIKLLIAIQTESGIKILKPV